MGVFNLIGDKNFWRLIPRHWVVCGQFFCTKHLVIQHYVGELYFFASYRWWNVTPLAHTQDLNSCCDSCAGIIKVEICVT